jgi:hypothetical protein
MILEADSGLGSLVVWGTGAVIAIILSSAQKKQKKSTWSSPISAKNYTNQPSESLINLNPLPQQSSPTQQSPIHSQNLRSASQLLINPQPANPAAAYHPLSSSSSIIQNNNPQQQPEQETHSAFTKQQNQKIPTQSKNLPQSAYQGVQQQNIDLHQQQTKLPPQVRQLLELQQEQYFQKMQELEALKEKEETRLHQLQTQTNTLNVNNVASGLKLTKNEIIFWQILGTCPGIRRLTRTRTTSKF